MNKRAEQKEIPEFVVQMNSRESKDLAFAIQKLPVMTNCYQHLEVKKPVHYLRPSFV